MSSWTDDGFTCRTEGSGNYSYTSHVHHPCARLTLYRRRGGAEVSDVAGVDRELTDKVFGTADDPASFKSDVWKEKR